MRVSFGFWCFSSYARLFPGQLLNQRASVKKARASCPRLKPLYGASKCLPDEYPVINYSYKPGISQWEISACCKEQLKAVC